MASTSAATASGSTVSGRSPDRPSRTATSVVWPRPVSASEPYSSTRTCAAAPAASAAWAKRRAAHIGPTVCELDGPMPILNRSNTLSCIVVLVGWPAGQIDIIPGSRRASNGLRFRCGEQGAIFAFFLEASAGLREDTRVKIRGAETDPDADLAGRPAVVLPATLPRRRPRRRGGRPLVVALRAGRRRGVHGPGEPARGAGLGRVPPAAGAVARRRGRLPGDVHPPRPQGRLARSRPADRPVAAQGRARHSVQGAGALGPAAGAG